MKIKCINYFRNGYITCNHNYYYNVLGLHEDMSFRTPDGKYLALKIEGEHGYVGPVYIHQAPSYFDITQCQIDKLMIFSS